MSASPQSRCPVHGGFDPLTPSFLSDPFATLASLRGEMPVFYAPSIGYYIVTRYADIESVFLDSDTYSAAPAQQPLVELTPEAQSILRAGGITSQPSMVSVDEPAHRRLRVPAIRAFTPQRVLAMTPRIQSVVDQLLDAIDRTKPFDLVKALTFPLPATIIFTFLGIPERDWQQLKDWCGGRATLMWGRPAPGEQKPLAEKLAAYYSYLRDFVAEKARNRDNMFTSALLAIHDENPEQLTQGEITSILFSLSFAGHETTNYLLGQIVLRLLEDPSRWDALAADPSLISGAIDETLRFDSSVPSWRRVTKHPVTLGGVDLPAGAKLFLWLAAAGRDASVFPEPDVFDMRRENASQTLTFGKGKHYCLGAALGKLESKIALEGLTRRFPKLRLVEGRPIRFHPNISFRGPQELWVRASG